MERPASNRQLKVAREIQKDMAEILRSKGMAAFGGAMVTVSEVRVSPDLSLAKTYVSIFPSAKSDEVMKILKDNVRAYRGELGRTVGGFEKNLMLYRKVFAPIVKYAEDLGVTLVYENCPMEGWQPAAAPDTYNNLPCTLAARKLMYALVPSRAHGEIYDPSHDVWQHVDPSDVIEASDMRRIRRIHIKGTRNYERDAASVHWGRLFPEQTVDPKLA